MDAELWMDADWGREKKENRVTQNKLLGSYRKFVITTKNNYKHYISRQQRYDYVVAVDNI